MLNTAPVRPPADLQDHTAWLSRLTEGQRMACEKRLLRRRDAPWAFSPPDRFHRQRNRHGRPYRPPNARAPWDPWAASPIAVVSQQLCNGKKIVDLGRIDVLKGDLAAL